VPNLKKRVESLECEHDLKCIENLFESEKQEYVVVVQDPFTSFYDAQSVEKLIVVIKKLGLNPLLLPFSPNGKAQHVKGFLSRFENTAETTASLLNKVHALGLPMIGADASLVLCYRDEYEKILGEKRGEFSVHTITEWMSQISPDKLRGLMPERTAAIDEDKDQTRFRLLAHCTEKTALPKTEQQWQQIYSLLGLTLEIVPVGCCGMAGTYGHEVDQLDNSKGIYELSWAGEVAKTEERQAVMLATGYSCRSQVKRFENLRPKHPIEVLADLA
jgi:Fe-S oxidoreductase